MIRRTAILVVCVTAAVRAAGPLPPSEVYRRFADAMAGGRVDDARQWAVADDKRQPLVAARPAAAEAERRYAAALDKAFPGKRRPIDYGPSATRPDDTVDAPRVVIDKDTATLLPRDSIDAVKFRRVDGQWKVDLNAMYPPGVVEEIVKFRSAMVEVMNAMAAEVEAGRYSKIQDVQSELATRIKMRLATPDLPATTRPTF